jgi:arginine decarboxylase
MLIPKKVFFTKGVGHHTSKLGSFEKALRDAGIACYNLSEVSSIFPPNAEIIERNEGVKLLRPGEIVYLVLSRNSSDRVDELLTASIGLAIPKDRSQYGYISEHHSTDGNEKESGEFAENLATEMLASTLGLNKDTEWDEKILLTRNITSVSRVKKELWTTVIAAAVMIP